MICGLLGFCGLHVDYSSRGHISGMLAIVDSIAFLSIPNRSGEEHTRTAETALSTRIGIVSASAQCSDESRLLTLAELSSFSKITNAFRPSSLSVAIQIRFKRSIVVPNPSGASARRNFAKSSSLYSTSRFRKEL